MVRKLGKDGALWFSVLQIIARRKETLKKGLGRSRLEGIPDGGLEQSPVKIRVWNLDDVISPPQCGAVERGNEGKISSLRKEELAAPNQSLTTLIKTVFP